MTFSSMTINTQIKVILDTNMLLSAFVFGGMVEIIIDLIVESKLQLYTSSTLSKEVFRKLHEHKASEKTVKDVIALFKGSISISPKIIITASRDPKDNFVLELAEEAEADYIITRDKDLLELPGKIWKNTKITKPEDFLSFLRKIHLI